MTISERSNISTNTKTLQQYNEAFQKELERLNEGQQKAVQQIEGPVLVIAGPGTGKTHMLTARIGKILLETDAQANNILCLTFTEAGVHAMRQRLLEFIGPEAHRVHIYTFHSFCNNIIQDNLERFGRHELEPLNELERVELIRRLIDELPPDHRLKMRSSDLYFYERHLYDLFKRMKAEDWSVAYIQQKIKTYLEDLPNRKEYIYQKQHQENKKGDLKQWKYDEAKEKMDRLSVAAKLFPRYLRLMNIARRYDFDDMILWVLRAFEEHEALLRTYQERYLYFLVDEYQDTNGAQNNILQKLIAYWNNPNIFIVGDDDQSIYEFQGARLKNLTDFYHDYQKDLTLVLLKDNYRSSQHILDSSRFVIDHNQNRIVSTLEGVEKVLNAQNQAFAQSNVLPHIVEYENRAQEEADLVHQIEQLQKEGFPLEETAIIYARHRQVRNIINLLEKKGIPYNTKRQVNILDLPEMLNLRMLLEYINAEHLQPYSGEHLLFKIMHIDFLGISVMDLAKMSFHLARREENIRWRDLINRPKILQHLRLDREEAILRFAQLINHLLRDYQNFTLPQLIERIFNHSGLLQHLLQKEDRNWQLQVINTFFNFVQKETDKQPRLDLKKLLEIFANMDANRLSIGLQKIIHAKNGVNLVTAHSSKGLEFQRVFLIDTVKDQWEPAKGINSRRFALPDTLTLSGEEDAMEARRRLFYVAMTRAKEVLHISYSKKDKAGKSLQRALYVDELLTATQRQPLEKKIAEATLFDAQLLLLTALEKPKIPPENKATIDALLEGFALSITSLNRFLRCPLSFYYQNVLHLPSVQSEAASYGIAAHFALSKLFERKKGAKDKQYPSQEEFIQFFKDEMYRQSGRFTPKEFDRRMEIGLRQLPQYYQQNQHTWPENALVEHNIRNIEIDGAPVVGTIDRIDFPQKGNKVHIVDYKTGRQERQKFRKLSEKNPYGGIYRRQLIFYKLLYEGLQSEFKVNSAEIAYLDPDANGHFPRKAIKYEASEVAQVRKIVKESYTKIKNHEFYEGCGEKNCPWCNFVKHNIMVDSFADREGEDLDD
ncbi:MAG: ATP-dependent DNA helicase [Bacteroidota bacterium]